jgi:hypothetical protein
MRRQIADGASSPEIGNDFWEPGDEWVDHARGISVDIMYRDVRWIREQIDRVLVHHQPSIGYTTCFWYNVLHSQPLYDRQGWFAKLQEHCRQPYPEALQRAILAKNYPILQRNQSSYLHQITLAVKRGDVVSVQHRVTALLASYFDILFAINRQPHPGEKRLLTFAQKLCPNLPKNMERDLRGVLNARGRDIILKVECLLNRFDIWLEESGFLQLPRQQ